MAKKATHLTAEEIQALMGDNATPEGTSNEDLVEAKRVEFAELDRDTAISEAHNSVNFLYDVPMTVEAILGSTEVSIKDVLEIAPGSVVELDKAYGEPVDIYLNGRLVARGDVVIVGEQFGVKITEILVSAEEMGAVPPEE
ncbi:MAG: flagellar motor switch protein FliN [Sulfobacillus benefaciens]|uniref:Flagellar motor switch protein FliN n=1 Tax=Sulfobacillus benefaciens TaxID=453960 RepID=A0A2T2XGR8_9FIRM|nr:MAG: flagellar motor switch protein FliN [Sulfobacillus benefaciens]